MKGKMLCGLAVGYVAGIVVASKFGAKQSECDVGGTCDCSVQKFAIGFVRMHEKLFAAIGDLIAQTDSTQFAEWQKQAQILLKDFETDAQKAFVRLKTEGEKARVDIEKEVVDRFETGKKDLYKLRESSLILYKDSQETIKKSFDKALSELEVHFSDFKKRFDA